MPSPPVKIKILLVLAKSPNKLQLNFSRGTSLHIKTRVSLRYSVADCYYQQRVSKNEMPRLVVSATGKTFQECFSQSIF